MHLYKFTVLATSYTYFLQAMRHFCVTKINKKKSTPYMNVYNYFQYHQVSKFKIKSYGYFFHLQINSRKNFKTLY